MKITLHEYPDTLTTSGCEVGTQVGVSANIQRCGEHTFAHAWSHISNPLQDMYLRMWDAHTTKLVVYVATQSCIAIQKIEVWLSISTYYGKMMNHMSA